MFVLLYTPTHAFYWMRVKEAFPHRKMIVLDFSGTIKLESSNYQRVYVRGSISFYYAMLKVYFLSLIKCYDLMLPHMDHLFGNVLFFNKRLRHLHILEDGILNYYEAIPNRSVRERMKRRYWLTRLTPFRYKIIDGGLSGTQYFDSMSVTGWFTCPENIYQRDKYRALNKIDFSIVAENKCSITKPILLMVDQPIHDALEDSQADLLIERMKNKIAEFEKYRVLIKLHPSQTDGVATIGEDYDVLNSNKIVEELLVELRPNIVISYISTALVNVKNISPTTRCIALGFSVFESGDRSLLNVRKLFLDSGVEIDD